MERVSPEARREKANLISPRNNSLRQESRKLRGATKHDLWGSKTALILKRHFKATEHSCVVSKPTIGAHACDSFSTTHE